MFKGCPWGLVIKWILPVWRRICFCKLFTVKKKERGGSSGFSFPFVGLLSYECFSLYQGSGAQSFRLHSFLVPEL